MKWGQQSFVYDSDIDNPDIIRFPNIADAVLYIFLAPMSVLFKLSSCRIKTKKGTDIQWSKSLNL